MGKKKKKKGTYGSIHNINVNRNRFSTGNAFGSSSSVVVEQNQI